MLIFVPCFAARQQQPRDGPAADALRLPDAGLPRPPHLLLHRRLRLPTLPLLTVLPVSRIETKGAECSDNAATIAFRFEARVNVAGLASMGQSSIRTRTCSNGRYRCPLRSLPASRPRQLHCLGLCVTLRNTFVRSPVASFVLLPFARSLAQPSGTENSH